MSVFTFLSWIFLKSLTSKIFISWSWQYGGTKQPLSISAGFLWERLYCQQGKCFILTFARIKKKKKLFAMLQIDNRWVCNLTISWDAVGLARLRVASISCGLLHSCGVLRLSIRRHVLGRRGRKNMRICSAIWHKEKQKKKWEMKTRKNSFKPPKHNSYFANWQIPRDGPIKFLAASQAIRQIPSNSSYTLGMNK